MALEVAKLGAVLNCGSMVLASTGASVLMLSKPVGFVAVKPDNVQWIANSHVLGVQAAVLLGNPEQAGPFIVRVKLPASIRIEPHTHREARTYTILEGEWKLGFGEK